MSNCNCRNNCTSIALIVSVAIGIITAFLTITASISVTSAFLWVLFGIAVAYLAVVLITSAFIGNIGNNWSCITSVLSVLLIAILATVLFSVILLAVEFPATSIAGAIITGLLLLSFSLTLAETACLARCLITGNS